MTPITITLAASGGTTMQKTAGRYLNIMACSLPLAAAFNGGPAQPVAANQTYDKKAFTYFTLTNNNATPVTVTFSAGDHPANSQPADNSTSNAATYPLGNLGIAVGAAAGVAFSGSPACDANGFLQITNAMALVVGNVNNGHRRQMITFTMAPTATSAVNLNILDANGFAFMTIGPGAVIAIPYDTIFTLSGAGGTAFVTVGQVYLASN